MKKWLAFSVAVWMTGVAFGQEVQDTVVASDRAYEINGRINGAYEGKVYLVQEERMHGPQTRIDSCDVVDGCFRFVGEAPEHSVIYFIQSKDGQLAPIFLEKGNLQIEMRANYFLGAVTRGSINNGIWQLHQMKVKHWIDSMLVASDIHYKRFGRGSAEVEDSLFRHRTNEQNSKKLNMERDMVKFYNDQAFAPFIMLFEMTNELSLDELKALRGQLDASLNEHPYTKELDELIANKEFKVGIEAPAFHIRGIDGKEIELKDYAGKYVLIDFWASWCGPCRREMPNVVKLYKECKGKNFEIIGISLDRKEADWKKAVKDLGMTWPQACDFLEWQSPVARKYNLSAVPYTVLVNPEGKVEAINLRGQQLVDTVKALLKKKK